MSSHRSTRSLTSPAVWARDGETPVTGEATGVGPTLDSKWPEDREATRSDELSSLFEQYSRSVLGAACRVLGDHGEAEEVVQEVFFYLYRKPQLFDPSKGSLKTWIARITFSRALDRKLYLARRRFYADGNVASQQLRAQTDLDQQIDAKLTRTHLERAFSELTDRQRRTIEFFYFEGLDLREISELLGEPLGSVRHHLYRGLARLRRSSLLRRLRI